MKILIIRFSSLGDIILLFPAIQAIRQNMPDSEIHVLTKEAYREVFCGSSLVDKVISIENDSGFCDLIRTVTALNRFRYSHIIDMHKSIRSILMSLFLKKEKISRLKKYTVRKYLTARTRYNFMKNVPDIVTRYKNTIKIPAIPNEKPPQHISNIFDRPAVSIPQINNKTPLAAICPGSRWECKTWGVDNYSSLAVMLVQKGLGIVLLGSFAEKDLCASIKEYAEKNGAPDSVQNFSGKLNIEQNFHVLKQCSLAVSNDSGLAHLAAAADIPVNIIFGPTTPSMGFVPPGKVATFEKRELYCRPCTSVGRNKCPEKHFRCMNEIKPKNVFEVIFTPDYAAKREA